MSLKHKGKFTIAGLGGTFDHFHQGHEEFLKFAATAADYLIIGITTEKMLLGKPLPELIQPWHERVKQVKRFCQTNHIACEIIELNDPYGPTIEPDTRIEALIVTEETVSGADKINAIRRGQNLSELPVHVFQMIKDERGEDLHAENIRAGLVSRSGRYFPGAIEGGLTLSAKQRKFFSEPQGKLVKAPTVRADRICLVGDYTLEAFLSFRWPYDLAIFDNQTRRGAYNSPLIAKLEIEHQVKNPAGTITSALVTLLRAWQPGTFRHVFVDGEEDLATVALVLTLPLESVIYYGQPNKGLVELKVTEKTKNRFYEALVPNLSQT